MNGKNYNTVIIGNGPAGTGLLFNAIKKKQLSYFLNSGLAFVERSNNFCCGSIGKYIINSDTEGRVFLECLQDAEQYIYNNEKIVDLVAQISKDSGSSIPLARAGMFLKLIGSEMINQIHRHPGSDIFQQSMALSVHKEGTGKFLTRIVSLVNGREFFLKSNAVVFAMGGRQDRELVLGSILNHQVPLKNYEQKILLTDFLFTADGLKAAKKLILKARKKKIVVIGSSHSAVSAILLLLTKMKNIVFEENDITLLYRGRFRLYYPCKEEALAENYTDFTGEDICPVTNRVHRMGGLRLDTREMMKRILGLNREKEKSVRVINLSAYGEKTSELKKILEDAVLVIPAFGYSPRTIPLFDEEVRAIELSGNSSGPLVNKDCRILDADGNVIEGLFGIGLASGFRPWGKLGGEPGFKGQTNGLWLYQNGVGEIIYNQLLPP